MDASNFNKLKKMLLLIGITASLTMSSAYALGLLSRQSVTNTTGITASVDVGVYKNSLCTQNLTSIDWGVVRPSDNVTFIAYISNIGNVNINLQLETANWNPQNTSNYMVLSWNYAGQAIAPKEIVEVAFKLAVSPNMYSVGAFSFNIVITSSG